MFQIRRPGDPQVAGFDRLRLPARHAWCARIGPDWNIKRSCSSPLRPPTLTQEICCVPTCCPLPLVVYQLYGWPTPDAPCKVPLGLPKDGWLNALLAAQLSLSLIPSQGSENSLNMERFTVLVPGPYRMFLLTLPKVPFAG